MQEDRYRERASSPFKGLKVFWVFGRIATEITFATSGHVARNPLPLGASHQPTVGRRLIDSNREQRD